MSDTQPAVLTDKERTNRVIDSLHDLAWAMCHPQAGEAESEQFSGAVRLLCDEQAALRAQVEQLTAKLPCGHRKVDWDDSYGGCVACSVIGAAHEHDDCPERDEMAATIDRTEK